MFSVLTRKGLKKKKLYYKILGYVTLIVCVTIMIVSALQYYNARDNSIRQINDYSTESLQQISYSAQLLTDTARDLLSQLFLDADVSSLLNNNNPDEKEIVTGIKKLDTFKNSLDFIQSIYVFNRNNNMFYSTLSSQSLQPEKDFFDTELVSMLKNPDKINKSIPISRKILLPNVPQDERNYIDIFTFIYMDKGATGEVDNAIIINISERWLRGVIQVINSKKLGDIVIVNHAGHVISSDLTYSQVKDIERSAGLQQIMQSDKGSGDLTAMISGSKSLINYVSLNHVQWKFIRITKYQEFSKQFTQPLVKTVVFSLVIMLSGVVLSLFLGRMVYKPVDSVLVDLENQLFQSKGDRHELKNTLLSKLLLSEELLENKLESQLQKFGIPFSIETEVVLVLFKIDHFQEFCNTYTSGDRKLMKYAMLNIASEIMGSLYPNEPVDLDHNQLALILFVDNDTETLSTAAFKSVIINIQESVANYLNLTLTTVISHSGSLFFEANKLYQQAMERSFYRFDSKEKTIIFCDEMEIKSTHDYLFPVESCKIMVDNLMLGRYEDSEKIFKEIIESTRGYSLTTIQTVLSKLIIHISDAVEQINKNAGISLSVHLNSFITHVTTAETISDVYTEYELLLEKIQTLSLDKKLGKHEELMTTVNLLIQKDFTDVNLCLGSIAETLGMSSLYLGRIFKKHTSKSVSDCINEVRLQHAMNLLKDTTLPISKIVAASGFANDKYFFTIFKKLNGITPNEYRSHARKLRDDMV
ncbi:AraC family transcriptional regulator [Paenibacillus roseipurpureus]|uniref:Helix-turn-helix domain-containing protein n=1 Tax=Paenibacillus roseopurpureus TaxID=2918901 RepID=A0AA96LNY8_9BACL|nr:helix-turn-helix domain-containing protein [Paenibacillus sp. MBLB1832]WNR44534.1 helix-turn-helix domain-containing protein [Paenibacillus sp. MBLB1832]